MIQGLRRLQPFVLVALAGLVGFQCGGPVPGGPALPATGTADGPLPSGKTGSADLLPPRTGFRRAGSLGPGEAHAFAVFVPRGWFLHLLVEQRGVDVVVTASDPAGRQVLQVDSPNGDQGPEALPLVAGSGGRHRIEVRAGGTGSGAYELRIDALRPTMDRDRRRATAAILLAEGETLRRTGGTAALSTAAERYQRAIPLWRQAGAPFGEAVTWRRLGYVQSALGDPRQEIHSYRQALPLFHVLGDRGQEARLLNAEGLAHLALADWKTAADSFQRGLAVARAARDARGVTLSLNNLAVLAQTRGELGRALDLFDQALAGFRTQGPPTHQALALHNLGTVYLELNRLPEARDALEEALRIWEESRDPAGEARALVSLGLVSAWEEDPRRALRFYHRALERQRERGDLAGQAVTLDRMGTALLELGRTRIAASAFRQAAQIFDRLDDRLRLGWTLANEGRLLERQGLPRQAAARYLRAEALLREVGDRAGEAYALYGQACVARGLGRLDEARARIETALGRLESLRRDAPGHALRSSYFAPRRRFYEVSIDILMRLHERSPKAGYDVLALEASERTRARDFLEALTEAGADLRRGDSPGLLARQRELEARINAVERTRWSAASLPATRRAVLERELRSLLLDYDKLQARLRTGTPELAAWSRPLPLRTPGIQRLLDDGTVLLVYWLGEDRSFLWRVDRRTVRSSVLPPRAGIERLAREGWELLSRPQTTGAAAQTGLVLGRLSDQILGPVAGTLRGQRLAVVTDGALGLLPFAALPVGAERRPLVLDHEVVHLESPSVLALLRQRKAARSRPPLEVAVLADPVFSRDDQRVPAAAGPVQARARAVAADLRRSTGDLGMRDLGRLLHSRREAEVLRSLVPHERLLSAEGFAATRELALSGELRRYRIVHFATHGLLHPSHPELSGLVLSLWDERGRPRDGFLRSYELFGLRLPADLVVLSACRMAPDPEAGARGLWGMTRGLMVAGAPQVMMSLWSVDDRSTADLMERFYRGLLVRKLPPSAALREAQRSLLADAPRTSPYYWAPFVLQGDWR